MKIVTPDLAEALFAVLLAHEYVHDDPANRSDFMQAFVGRAWSSCVEYRLDDMTSKLCAATDRRRYYDPRGPRVPLDVYVYDRENEARARACSDDLLAIVAAHPPS